MIKVDALSRIYTRVVAVNNVSFEIGPREIVGLLGHNGAGKTTILKILTGFLEPSSGTVTIDGLNVCDDRQMIQGRIGYLPESSPLYPEMTVLDYLHYAAELRGVAPEKKQDRIIYALQKTKIVDVALRPINTLSRGYKQRLGVAQAILNSPSILILDEPTNGLDPSQILEMRSLIRELAETATIIISTHILQEVQALCGRVIIINQGNIALDAKLDTLQTSDRLLLSMDSELETYTGFLEKFGLKIAEFQKKRDQNQYILEAKKGTASELTPEIVRYLVEASCKIYAISPIERDLETIFREITAGAAFSRPQESSMKESGQNSQKEMTAGGKKETSEGSKTDIAEDAGKAPGEGTKKETVKATGKDGSASE